MGKFIDIKACELGILWHFFEENHLQMNKEERISANSQQPTANSQQPTANSQQPTANSQQPTALSEMIEKAHKGDVEAQYALGTCYYKGLGLQASQKEAVRWYRKAAEQHYAAAQYMLALCYYEGKGVFFKDRSEALKWGRKAVAQGYCEEVTTSYDTIVADTYGTFISENFPFRKI